MSTRPWIVVAKREYGEGARSKWFLVMCLLAPLLFAGMISFAVWAQLRGIGKTARLVLVDGTEEAVGSRVAARLEAKKIGHSPQFSVAVVRAPVDESALSQRIEGGQLDGYVVLPFDATTGGLVVYRGSNASSNVEMDILERSLRSAIVEVRAQALGLSDDKVTALLAPISFVARQPVAHGEEATGGAAFAVAYAISLLLYFAIVLHGVAVMRSVILEKSSRVMEIVVSCARPWDLMLGKVAGIGLLGLTQLAIWAAIGGAVLGFRGVILARLSIPDTESMVLPSVGAGQIVCVLLFFLGGYFLYASLLAAVGAANESERDAQQAQMPIMMGLFVAFMCFPIVSGAPRDTLAVVLTTVPFFSPVLMPMRALLTPVPAWQMALSLLTLFATIALALWCSARIFRVGILMYGKRTTLRELVRWVRLS